VNLAKRTGAVLVTEDEKLVKKINGYIKVISAEELPAQ
jgi:predicted nucleic acid-binding protein